MRVEAAALRPLPARRATDFITARAAGEPDRVAAAKPFSRISRRTRRFEVGLSEACASLKKERARVSVDWWRSRRRRLALKGSNRRRDSGYSLPAALQSVPF